MTKRTFRPRGRPDNSTSCFNNKNAKTYRETNAQRGQLSDNNCQSFNSNSKITRFFLFLFFFFFLKKMLQDNPNM